MADQAPEGGFGNMGFAQRWLSAAGNATAMMVLVGFMAVVYYDARSERREQNAATAEHGREATKAINDVNSTMQVNAKEVGEVRQTLQRMEWQGKLQGVPWLGGKGK